ncbi:hypothetical protein [Rhodospira trueperi]|uniref:Uncharacterized protein n=1 Tax=Rhodospira trueperi TaxID=69960 RepID=A0A1G6XU04_9PROT|nr:hypothetical protein [Rhodospira trueperi]SDD81658.1 hypothetical protein SAMN05421720_101635 [Rhodospira trueperi]
MFTLFRLIPVREALTAQIPVLVAAFAVAELFYKFGSFMLECLAFLATWFVFDLVVHLARRQIGLMANAVDSGS